MAGHLSPPPGRPAVVIFSTDADVRHIAGWYAQKHPDEDFAETFRSGSRRTRTGSGGTRDGRRLTKDGRIYVIEANPNPWLAPEAELAITAGLLGRSYTDLIGQIVELTLARYAA